MRAYLDSILVFIGASSLTDVEFGGIDIEDTEDQVAVYESLLGVLESRELISDSLSRLEYYFKAKGVDVPPPEPARSQIFVGSAL